MAAHTYWRLYIGAMSNMYTQIGTVSFLNAAQVNQSTGGTATASSEYSGSWAAGNAFDGNPTSEWASAGVSSSEWIAYQHPSPVDIVAVGVKVSFSYPVSGLALQYSDDGVSWSDASPLYLLAGQPALTSGSYTVLGLSASRRPLVLVGGRTQELPEGDTLPPQTPATHSHATSDVAGLDDALDAKQDALVSGTNIKTINGTSLLGSGNITTIPDAPSDGKTYGRKDAAWSEVVAGGMPPLLRSARTSNTMIAAADKGQLIDITSGTFSQTFAAAATLGDGWWCYLGNSGTGDITLDPDGAETIDGLASYVMYPGEVRLVQCDGAALRSIVLKAFSKTFTASGNFIKPPGYSLFESLIWSAGSSGQKSGGTGAALGGGGGGCFPARIPAGVLPSTVAITVGAGGVARTTASVGAVGGDSSIGTLIVVGQQSSPERGGAVRLGPYVASTAGAWVGDFGAGTGGPAPCLYGGGGSVSGNDAGPGIYGAGAGGVVENNSALRNPGTSVFGGAGGAAGDAVSGTDGTAPGGGGGGTRTGTQSGAGARGEVRIWGVL